MHLLADFQTDRLQLPGNLEGQNTDLRWLQDAGETANAALRLCRNLIGAETADRWLGRLLFFFAAVLQAEEEDQAGHQSR